MLPNFLCIGAHKAGTTSLAAWLQQHPQVYLPELKEARYFAYDPHSEIYRRKPRLIFPIRTLQEYEQLFEPGRGRKAIGEVSPQYLPSEHACTRIAETIPAVRLLAIIRHPVSRAYSQYWMRVRTGSERKPFCEAVRSGEPWVRNSLYYDNLKRYSETFGDERLKVILFEELVSQPSEVLLDLCNHLRIQAELAMLELPRENVGTHSRFPGFDRITRSPKLRALLRPFFPHGIRRAVRGLRAMSPPIPALSEADKLACGSLFLHDAERTSELLGKDLVSLWRLR